VHAFAIGIGLDQDAEERLLAGVDAVCEDFRLDPDTQWTARSGSGAVLATGVHHPPAAIGARRYVLAEPDRAVLFDGLPVDALGQLSGYDASVLDAHWGALPERIDGLFCAVRVDLGTDEVQILLDPLGMVPVFYGRTGEKAAVSTHARVVASALAIDEIDPLAVATIVALGWAAESRTFWRDIFALAGGSVHTVGPAGLSSREHFGPRTLARQRRTRSAAELAQSLVTMMRRVGDVGGPIRCAVTGGLDTRVIAALLMRAEVPAEYFTLGPPDSPDVVIAQELAARFGWSHETDSKTGRSSTGPTRRSVSCARPTVSAASDTSATTAISTRR
jgi:asparagine synthase (glutamine-hydrolysing)